MPGHLSRFVKHVFVYLLLCLFNQRVQAQLKFFNNESASATPKECEVFVDTSNQHTIQRYAAIRSQFQPIPTHLNLTYKNQMLWLRLPLKKISKDYRYLLLRNPHINYVGAWVIHGAQVDQSFPLTGDHLPFASRTIEHTDFVFPLPYHNDSLSLLLLMDKRNEVIHIPLHFFTEQGFIIYSGKKNLVIGLCAGLGIFLFFFNLFLFIQMREKVYVFYGLYIAMGLFYIFSDYGYSLMYLFPDHPHFSDLSRPLSISLATPLYFLFCTHLLKTKAYFPVLYKWLMRLFYLYIATFVLCIPLMPDTGSIRITLHLLMQILQMLIIGWILIASITALMKGFPYASFVIVTTVILLIAGTGYSLYISGYIPDTFVTRNFMTLGFSIEITILAFVLTMRFKAYKERSEQLVRQVAQQQEQIFRTITDYQERELQRLSSLLHDSIGAQLSALRLHLESISSGNGVLKQTIHDLSEIANEVRSFSHNLSPALLQKKGLIPALQQQVAHINQSNKLHIQFESLGAGKRAPFRYEVLIYNIIQELLQNVIKHAYATEAIVQLLIEEDIVSIFVEDNGSGCDPDKIKEGLGFTQIKQLVTFVNGRFQLTAAPNQGCQVSIEFILLPDESKPAPPYSRRS